MMRFYGIINPFESKPSFLLPIFIKQKEYFIQIINERDCIESFLKINLANKQIITISNDYEAEIGFMALYAFEFSNGEIKVHNKLQLKEILLSELSNIDRYEYVFLDVLEFTQEYQIAIDFLQQQKENWAKYELKKFKELLNQQNLMTQMHLRIAARARRAGLGSAARRAGLGNAARRAGLGSAARRAGLGNAARSAGIGSVARGAELEGPIVRRSATVAPSTKRLCPFCNGLDINGEVNTVSKYISPNGRVIPRAFSGICRKHHRLLSLRVKEINAKLYNSIGK